MSLSSLRVLLLALAMVVQTIAAGAIAAAPRSEGSGQSAIEICAEHAAHNDAAAPAKNKVGHKHCDKCLACCGAQGVAVAAQTNAIATVLFVSRVAVGLSIEAPPPTIISHISGARGPPSARA